MEQLGSSAGQLYRESLKAHPVMYALGVFSLLLTSLSEVMVPKVVEWTVNTLQSESVSRTQSLEKGLMFLLVLMGFGFVGRIGWRQFLARRTHEAGYEMKIRIWDALRPLSLAHLERYSLGDLMNRATGDWNASRAIHGFTIVQTLDIVFFATLSILMMLTLHVPMTLVVLLVFPPIGKRVLTLARKEHELHHRAQEQLSVVSEKVTQFLTTVRLQRATGSEGPSIEGLKKESLLYAEKRNDVLVTSWKIFPLGALPTLLAYTVLITYGVYLLKNGQMTLGAFVAFMSYVLMLQNPLFELGDCIGEWQRGMASLGRLGEIFAHTAETPGDTEKEMKGGTVKSAGIMGPSEAIMLESFRKDTGLQESLFLPQLKTKGLVIKDLSFGYRLENQVLKNLSLEAKAGESIGILGPIGAGKSTFLSLISGLIFPPKKSVAWGGIYVEEVDRLEWTKIMTYVPQKVFLFSGTVHSNLCLGENKDLAELWEVLQVVYLDQEVKSWGGLQAEISESGINLSGGQRQRLALARALLRRRPILLLDDALSAVDPAMEEAILMRMKGWYHEGLLIHVAHRLESLKHCSRVLSLNEGKLSDLHEKTT